MDFKPILSSLRRSPTGAILVALQIALALAIVVNSLYIVVQRLEHDRTPTTASTCRTRSSVGWTPHRRQLQRRGDDARGPRDPARPAGRRGGDASSTPCRCRAAARARTYYTEPNEKGTGRRRSTTSRSTSRALDTLGVKHRRRARLRRRASCASRRATPRRSRRRSCSRATSAKELFPDEPALGKTVYTALSQPATRRRHHRPHARLVADLGQASATSRCRPVIPDEQYARYLVRAEPGRRDELMKQAEEALAQGRQRPRDPARYASLEYVAASTLCGRPRDGGLPDAS